MKTIGTRGSQLYPYPTVCNFEMLIEVSPLAIVALVGVTFDLLKLTPVFAGAALAAAVQYVAGLIVIGRRPTAAKIARLLGGRDTGKWARATRVQLGELPAMTFVVVRDDLDGQGAGTGHLLASNPRLSATRVVKRYGSRWIIETFFEDLKGRLGLASYQGRSLEGQMRHVGLCFAACVVLDSLRRKSGMTLGEAKEAACRLVFARTSSSRWQLVSLEPTPAEGLEELEDAKKMVSGWLWRVSKLRLPRRLKTAS